jgi:hypothetical protein
VCDEEIDGLLVGIGEFIWVRLVSDYFSRGVAAA